MPRPIQNRVFQIGTIEVHRMKMIFNWSHHRHKRWAQLAVSIDKHVLLKHRFDHYVINPLKQTIMDYLSVILVHYWNQISMKSHLHYRQYPSVRLQNGKISLFIYFLLLSFTQTNSCVHFVFFLFCMKLFVSVSLIFLLQQRCFIHDHHLVDGIEKKRNMLSLGNCREHFRQWFISVAMIKII